MQRSPNTSLNGAWKKERGKTLLILLFVIEFHLQCFRLRKKHNIIRPYLETKYDIFTVKIYDYGSME